MKTQKDQQQQTSIFNLLFPQKDSNQQFLFE